MHISGFILQLLQGMLVTLELAFSAAGIGILAGLLGASLQLSKNKALRYFATSIILFIRGLPELLILFFIYFGMTAILTNILGHYVDINAFIAGVIALSLIFAAYASQVFKGAFLAIDRGQLEAGSALGLTQRQILTRIQIPQMWRHALPGLGNLWLVLLKDTAIVMLIGLPDLMSEAKIAASTTRQPFTFYLIAAFLYLIITSASQKFIDYFSRYANRYLPT